MESLKDPCSDAQGAVAPCYCRGTRILTERGETAIEDLAIGDRVMTRAGWLRPIKWIGRRGYAGRFVAGNRDVLPILIRRGALSDGVPGRDLRVSPEHALYIDGTLIPARHLVNEASIVQEEAVETVEYFHLELDSHDVILAEGAAAESFIDDDSRAMFHNAADFHTLYPGAVPEPARRCAPRIENGPLLAAVQQRLLGRGRRLGADGKAAPAALRGYVDLANHVRVVGWALDPATPEMAVGIVIRVDGETIGRVVADGYRRDLELGGVGDGRHGFALDLPGGLATARQHTIEFYSEADGTALPGSPVTLEPAATPAAPVLGPLRGSLDVANHLRVAGWAQDTTDPERPVGLAISVNGQMIGRVLANRHRLDLEQSGQGSGRHAFDWLAPTALPTHETQEIRVVREADGAELPGSPLILPAPRGFDAALEQGLAGLFSEIGRDAEGRALTFLIAQAERLLSRRAERQGGRAERDALRLFRRRWGGRDEAGGAAPAAASRALVVDDRVPCATRDAGSVAILSHIRALRALGYEVNFVAAEEIGEGAALAALAAAEGVTACGAPYYTCVEDVLRRQAGDFDLVYLYRAGNADRYLSLARRHCPKARIVYSVADLHHLRLARQAQVENRPELAVLSRRIAVGEMLAASRADLVITHSTAEAEALRPAIGAAKVHVVPFAVAPRKPLRPFAERRGIAILGSFEHTPNRDAADHLLHDILPLVWRRDPALTCKLAGHGWREERVPGHDPRVEVIGAVDDLDSLFDTVRLMVAPLRFGAGLKGKVLDSFAAGLPCVMTPIAAEGLPLPPSLRGLVAADPAALAELIVRYHADEAANTAAGADAARLAAQEFCMERVTEALGRALNPAARAAPPVPRPPDRAPPVVAFRKDAV